MSAWPRGHGKSPRAQSRSVQNGTSCGPVAGCPLSLQDAEKPTMTHDQIDVQSNSSTRHAAIDPTSLTSAYQCKMFADDTSCLTLHLSKKNKVLRRSVEPAPQTCRLGSRCCLIEYHSARFMDYIIPSCISMEKPGSTSVVASPRNQNFLMKSNYYQNFALAKTRQFLARVPYGYQPKYSFSHHLCVQMAWISGREISISL